MGVKVELQAPPSHRQLRGQDGPLRLSVLCQPMVGELTHDGDLVWANQKSRFSCQPRLVVWRQGRVGWAWVGSLIVVAVAAPYSGEGTRWTVGESDEFRFNVSVAFCLNGAHRNSAEGCGLNRGVNRDNSYLVFRMREFLVVRETYCSSCMGSPGVPPKMFLATQFCNLLFS